jgi:hypothetical protein
VTASDLLAAGCPPRVVAAVEALTRRHNEDYETFVARAARDPIARVVKRADVADNVHERSDQSSSPDCHLVGGVI